MNAVAALQDLFHRRWNVPAMALLHRRQGEKFVALYRTLGASQGAMRQTLNDLLAKGWVEKNPGYGHPMRPEYVLTPQGTVIGEKCAELMAALDALTMSELALAKWPLPLVSVMGTSRMRYSQIAGRLENATDRAIALALKALTQCGALDRFVEDTYPPSVRYSLTPRGQRVFESVDELSEALQTNLGA